MNRTKKYRSDFLFVTPSALIGAGSILNIAGNYFSFNSSSSEREADMRALLADWGVVGNDISEAMEEVSHEENLETIHG